MIASRIVSVLIVVAAVGWIASGHVIGGSAPEAEPAPAPVVEARPPFAVAVARAEPREHARTVTLSGQTRADRRAQATTRASGTVVELAVRRGVRVETGDVIAVLSDEAREAQVSQATARLEQAREQAQARLRLIENGTLPALERSGIEADLRAAEAALAQAQAERDRSVVRAPISGIVDAVPAEIGQALQVGDLVAEVISLDPMLVVVEIAERQLGGVRVGDEAQVRLVTGQTATGEVRFVSSRASEGTRTYRVEIGIDNADNAIPDGVTAEARLRLAAVPAAPVPRSALTFSSEGLLGLRIVDDTDHVAFVPVDLVEDGRETIFVSGLPHGAAVIVQGQDFVVDGQRVAPVPMAIAARR